MIRTFLKLLFFTVVCSQTLFAQYTEIINSSKPGVSETAYPVGTDVIQFENNLGFGNFNTNNSEQSFVKNHLVTRYGKLLEELEFQSIIDYWSIDRDIAGVIENTKTSGFKKFALGAKYKFFQHQMKEDSLMVNRSWKAKHKLIDRLIPTVASFANVNLFGDDDFNDNGGFSLNLGLTAQSAVTNYWTVINQLQVDYLFTNNPEFIYSLTNTYGMDKVSTFVEINLVNGSGFSANNTLLGANYLFNKDLVVHAYTGFDFGGGASGLQFNIGASYRLDYHRDRWIKKEKEAEPVQKIDPKTGEIIVTPPAKKEAKGIKKLFNKIFKAKEGSLEKHNLEEGIFVPDELGGNPEVEEAEVKEKKIEGGLFKGFFKKKKKDKQKRLELEEGILDDELILEDSEKSKKKKDKKDQPDFLIEGY